MALASVCVRRLGGSRAGEVRLTRFLRNAAVTPEAMLDEAKRQLAVRCAGREVLAIQDTTVVRSTRGGGIYLHAVLAVDAEDGAILGLAHAAFLARSDGQRDTRRERAVADKESQRWLDGADHAAAACAQARRLTVVADRESDVYAAFAQCPPNVELLVRAAQDRCVVGGETLFAALDALPEGGRVEVPLPAAPGRRARTARVAVRWSKMALARPRNGVATGPRAVEVMAVDVREIDAPPGVAPLHWRLLATRAVEGLADALEAVALYRRRWAIEQFFRTLKTQGFDIEGVRVKAEAPCANLVTAALIAGVAVQQLVHAREGDAALGPLRPLTDAFDAADQPLLRALCHDLEGKTARQQNPHPEGSLAWAAWICARLGGWTGYYGKPGPIVMLRGWLYFHAVKHGASLSRADV